ncbi:hypothetical protein TH61_13635 [Rufibacter sp. DG15C]|uniref:polysaccharide deacetylase family protein n=1 Tax=Rufibacter sp. DG15C TaxID=1379909 RepID=UPI00078C5EAE|nr:polysaccharide deacetylase family protein [Rufibacter sp. DG15C]AMM52016.1 hypothetical protein TH61_13635 [Rufibacter sp. DG15C]
MNILFEYVLFHFRKLYHLPATLEISYGHDGQSRIQITQTTSTFFERQQAQPVQVVWKEWRGTKLPLFFDEAIDQPWFFQNTQGQVIVPYDVIASAFYLLSGWQEYYGKDRDQFGRFPFKASLQARHRFITKPLVNYYFGVLREALEVAYGQKIEPKLWDGKPFATCLTHDVDYCQTAWKVAGKPALQKGNIKLFLQLYLKHLKGQDAWFNLPQVEKELLALNAKGTFFFLPEKSPYQGHPNADYDIASPKIQNEIKRLKSAGHEIALHGSHGSSHKARQLKQEREKIGQSVQGNRFHYLRFDPVKSLEVLEETNIHYDSSLGFPERFGFRNSYCHPFRLFDFKKRQMSGVWELPLNLMDITLNHPNYLQLKPEEVMPALTPMLQEIEKFHGVFTLLWHNENFTPYALPQGLELFREITQYVQKRGSQFLTAQQAVTLHS